MMMSIMTIAQALPGSRTWTMYIHIHNTHSINKHISNRFIVSGNLAFNKHISNSFIVNGNSGAPRVTKDPD